LAHGLSQVGCFITKKAEPARKDVAVRKAATMDESPLMLGYDRKKNGEGYEGRMNE
jgi:hypothetical protein